MNESEILRQFPLLARPQNGRRLVYLDSAATSQRPAAVLDAFFDYSPPAVEKWIGRPEL